MSKMNVSQEWEDVVFLAAGEYHMNRKARREKNLERKAYDKPAKYQKRNGKSSKSRCEDWDLEEMY